MWPIGFEKRLLYRSSQPCWCWQQNFVEFLFFSCSFYCLGQKYIHQHCTRTRRFWIKYGIFSRSNTKWGRGDVTRDKNHADPACCWPTSVHREVKRTMLDSGLNQRLLCTHLYKDLFPSHRPRSTPDLTGWADRAWDWRTRRRGRYWCICQEGRNKVILKKKSAV